MDFNIGVKHLFEATKIVNEIMLDSNTDIGLSTEETDEIITFAKDGKPGYDKKAQELIIKIMDRYGLFVAGMEKESAAYEIYKYLYGLDVLEEIYKQPNVDDLRVNRPDNVYYQESGRNKKADITFKDKEHLEKLITRILENSRGGNLDESNPGLICRRSDGARITALGPPLTKYPCFVIRKHGTFDISDENYINSGTMDNYILKLCSILAKGRSNILICGSSSFGKTTLLRWLVKHLHPALRIVSIELKRELELDVWYSGREIVPVAAHPEIGWDIGVCFSNVLVFSPDVIIVGETRGLGEASKMIDACDSGHSGLMGTIHGRTARETPRRLALMAYEEGRKLPIELLENQVASCFDIIIQMHGSSLTGVKRIVNIVEVSKGENGPEFSDLSLWVPSERDYEIGHWSHPNKISEQLAKKLFMYGVKKEELDNLERVRFSCMGNTFTCSA